jgi:sucrose phosphorylase
MLALRGIPGIYFHSLVGTPNYQQGVQESGQARRINRRKYGQQELATILADSSAPRRRILEGYRDMLRVRVRQPAFHPDAAQEVVDSGDPAVLAFQRTSLDGRQRILAVTNVADEPRRLRLTGVRAGQVESDLLTAAPPQIQDDTVRLEACQTLWLPLK